MMHKFKEDWELLFTKILRSIDTLGNNAVSVSETGKNYLNETKLVSSNCTIIDGVLLFCSNLDAILIYLERVCNFSLRY